MSHRWVLLRALGLLVALGVCLWGGLAEAQTTPDPPPTTDPPAACAGDYSGQWQTTYGLMTLVQDAASVTGTYEFGIGGTITGVCEDGRLVFKYHEQPSTDGEGWFELDAAGQSFSGRWRELGQSAWGQWEGRRAGVVASGQTFEGLFDTSYGRLRLIRDGDAVTGEYLGTTRGTLTGTVNGDLLEFEWREGADHGDGWFTMLPQNLGFIGQWRRPAQPWQAWQGTRVEPTPGVRWLVILETHWERSLAENEYAFGEMLRSYFERTPQVRVRHRRLARREDLELTAHDLTFLAEPVVLLIAGHGDASGLVIGSERLDDTDLAPLLASSPNVFLLHFSSCAIMAGDVASKIKAALPTHHALAISGYATPVDWGASAVLEMLFLDLVLARGSSPGDAARIVREELRFAGDRPVPGSPIGALEFEIVE